jgi:hypothetical protein
VALKKLRGAEAAGATTYDYDIIAFRYGGLREGMTVADFVANLEMVSVNL